MHCPLTFLRRARRCAFTLVEMLVVIGVMTVLVGILVPAVNLGYTYAIKAGMQKNIRVIDIALQAYKNDQNNFPLIDYSDISGVMAMNNPGAVVLCWALVAPGNTNQDGHGTNPLSLPDNPAPGFSAVPHGQVYGPYLEMDRFKLVLDNPLITPPNLNKEPSWCIADRYGHPILYFKANESVDVHTIKGYCDDVPTPTVGDQPYWNLHDNATGGSSALVWPVVDAGSTANALIRMRLMLGDVNYNGQIDGTEAQYKAPYLLWAAGPDELFGVDVVKYVDPGVRASMAPACDDVTSMKQ
jgi:prepilin-type N-terminal cleavage/methylation domain-containing protein